MRQISRRILSFAAQIRPEKVLLTLSGVPTGAGSITIVFKTAFVLRWVKTYLRSIMSQMRLNNIMILHAHKERTDALSVASCLNQFVSRNEHRLASFEDIMPFKDYIIL